MSVVTTSLKLSRRRKANECYEAFVRDGLRADKAMQQSGVGYDAGTVHAYLKAKASAAKTRRPRARRWLT